MPSETVDTWASFVPVFGEIKTSVQSIVLDLRSLSGYIHKQEEPERSGEDLEPECDDTVSNAPRVRSLLHTAGIPRPLSTKLEEFVATLSLGLVPLSA